MRLAKTTQPGTLAKMILTVTVTILACGLATPLQARSLAEIKQSKELRVCIVPLHPSVAAVEPADCRENCKFSGPVYEESLAFAKTLGNEIQPKFLRVDWDEQFFNKEGKTDRKSTRLNSSH